MKTSLLPFNIKLLSLSENDIKGLRPIKVLDIFEGQSKNFHSDGLFSIDIFGKFGESKRNKLFAYIDLNIDIFHPLVFKVLCDLKSLYGEIMASKTYAIFNEATNDFEKSDIINGKTGYSFFIKHFKQLKFEERKGAKREFSIKLIEKYKDTALLNKYIVMPAGLRDYSIDENGKPSEDEINTLYRKIISISSMITNISNKANLEFLDITRYNLQLASNSVYEYITNMLEGKSKLILGKWAGRKITNSTRNVITSYIPDTNTFNNSRAVNVNQTAVGLYQFLRAIMPLAVKMVRDEYLSKVFLGPNSPAVLVNKKTYKKELVNISPANFDEWNTYEGIEKTLARYGQENLRHDHLEIDDRYLGLIYKGDDRTFKFIQDIDELPDNRSKEHVTPITFTELLYMSVFKISTDIPCFVTRYPIAGYGSIYPSYIYLKTTVKSESRFELDSDWNVTDSEANEFPIMSEQFFNSVSPSQNHLKRLVADYDR